MTRIQNTKSTIYQRIKAGHLIPKQEIKDEQAAALSGEPTTPEQEAQTKLADEKVANERQLRSQRNFLFWFTLIFSFVLLVHFYWIIFDYRLPSFIATFFSNNSTTTIVISNNSTTTSIVNPDRLLALIAASPLTLVGISLSGIIPTVLLLSIIKGLFKEKESDSVKDGPEWIKISTTAFRALFGR